MSDFRGFTIEDMVNTVVAAVWILPGDGFAEVTPDDIYEIIEAGGQPLTSLDVLEIMEQDAQAQDTLTSVDQDDEPPCSRLSMSSKAKLMRKVHKLQDYSNEMDPYFQGVEMAKSASDRTIASYAEMYKGWQHSAAQTILTNYIRSSTTPPPSQPQWASTRSSSSTPDRAPAAVCEVVTDVSHLGEATTMLLGDLNTNDDLPSPDCTGAVEGEGL